MARRVYFSFHYDRDIRRVVQVRNSWVIRPGNETQPFLDAAEWEEVRRKSKPEIERWIDGQMWGTSVTVVLIGAETATREFVGYEIKRSCEEGKGMFGIWIHGLKDPQRGTDIRGQNPFDNWSITDNGVRRSLASIYPTYDWVLEDGYHNLASWIETAAHAAGR